MLYQTELQAHLKIKSCLMEATNKIKKEVIQPQVPLRLPCDDLTHLTEFRFDVIKRLRLTKTLLGWFDGRCVQGAGTHSLDRNEIRLLGIPTS